MYFKLEMNGKRKQSCPIIGKRKPPVINLIKITMTKLILLTCISLLCNEIIPAGWTTTDNFTEKKTKQKKKKKYKITKHKKNDYNSENQKKKKFHLLDKLVLWKTPAFGLENAVVVLIF